MNVESLFTEHYLRGNSPLPDVITQTTLNLYLKLYHRLENVIGRVTSTVPEETQEIAGRSSDLMETHYDQPLEMFEGFLGPTMKYSMGLWETEAANLEECQEAMMADLCRKADVQDGHTVLDLGCGFGSFSDYVIRHYPNARVCALNLSNTQVGYIRSKQAEPGHPLNSDRFELMHEDFNETCVGRRFDRVFSIGFFEHISNLSNALGKIRGFIADDGRLLLHYIVYRPRPGQPEDARQEPFLHARIFPGARIWSHTELAKHQGEFQLEADWFMSGLNYKRTLEYWLDNFRHSRNEIARRTGMDVRQLRLWEFYLRACIAVFNIRGGRYYGNGQYLLRPA